LSDFSCFGLVHVDSGNVDFAIVQTELAVVCHLGIAEGFHLPMEFIDQGNSCSCMVIPSLWWNFDHSAELSFAELSKAKHALILCVQEEHFEAEMLGEDGLLRRGRRLENSNLTEAMKNPSVSQRDIWLCSLLDTNIQLSNMQVLMPCCLL
jgi:hypothetical protein